jgi:hypothetical protein
MALPISPAPPKIRATLPFKEKLDTSMHYSLIYINIFLLSNVGED